jgi:hypothetical protein
MDIQILRLFTWFNLAINFTIGRERFTIGRERESEVIYWGLKYSVSEGSILVLQSIRAPIIFGSL